MKFIFVFSSPSRDISRPIPSIVPQREERWISGYSCGNSTKEVIFLTVTWVNYPWGLMQMFLMLGKRSWCVLFYFSFCFHIFNLFLGMHGILYSFTLFCERPMIFFWQFDFHFLDAFLCNCFWQNFWKFKCYSICSFAFF